MPEKNISLPPHTFALRARCGASHSSPLRGWASQVSTSRLDFLYATLSRLVILISYSHSSFLIPNSSLYKKAAGCRGGQPAGGYGDKVYNATLATVSAALTM